MLTAGHYQRAWHHPNLSFLNKKTKVGFEILEIDAPNKVKIDNNDYWSHLDGILYNGMEAHITITPGPDQEVDWTYFHFTPIGHMQPHAFYELLDNPAEDDYSGETWYIRRSNYTCGKSDKKRSAWNEARDVRHNGKSLPDNVDADVNRLIRVIWNA